MTTVLWIILGVTTVVCWGPLIYFMVTPTSMWRRTKQPSPLSREVNRWRAARERTYKRQAITPLGHIRLGQDTARHHR